MLRFNLTAHVWRGLFLFSLTTIVFYTFSGRNQGPAPAVISMSASVPRREAPPPPELRSQFCSTVSRNILIKPIIDQHTPILLNLFYRIATYIDADLHISDDWQNSDWNELLNSDRRAIIICLEDCVNMIIMLKMFVDIYSISILRDPVQVFKESFTTTWTSVKAFQRSGNDLVQFLAQPNYYYDKEESDAAHAKNFLSYSFDLDPNSDPYYLPFQNQIMSIDSTFDFIIISEYLLESLILLKAELCLNWDAMLFLYHSDDYVTSDSGDLNMQIRKWNSLDFELYTHFNQSLWSQIRDFNEINTEKEKYEAHLSRVKTICRSVLLESDRQFCAESNLSDQDVLNSVRNSGTN